MMNKLAVLKKLENYLESLDQKNRLVLYASVIFAGIILYYNINLSFLQDEIDYNVNVIEKLKKEMKSPGVLRVKLKKKKKTLNKVKKENTFLSENVKYVKMLIATSSVLHINENSFLEILRKILLHASENGITASYIIEEEKGDYVSYVINIKGAFERKNFKNFYAFIRDLEAIKAIKSIDSLTFYKVENVGFEINCKFWSLK